MPDANDPRRPTDPSAPPEPVTHTWADDAESWWERLPRAVRIVLGVAGFVLVSFVVRVLPDLLFGEEASTGRWIYLAVILVAGGLLVWWSVRAAGRRLGGPEQMRLFRQALRTGEIPPQANREAWRPGLERMRRASRRQRGWHVAGTVVPLALFVVFFGVVLVATDARAELLVLGGVTAVVLGALATWSHRMLRRNEQRAATLLSQLD